MTRARRRRPHGNPFHIRGPVEKPDLAALYGREAPLAIDIGFGAGAFLLELARRRPAWNVLGLEIRDFWVDEVLSAARAEGLANLHAVVANANVHLDDLVPDGSVVFVSINFPDPWFKKRHHKRRVVRTEFLDVLARKLAPGGELHYASDYGAAAEEALEIVRSHPRFEVRGGFAESSTTGIETERERTHTRRGDPIFRFVAVVRPPL